MRKITLLFFTLLTTCLVFAQPASYVDVGVIGPAGVFTFDTENSVNVLPSAGNTDTEMGLWDSSGTLLAADDDGGAGLWSLISINLADGVYYIGISEFNSVFANGFLNTGTAWETGDLANLDLNINGSLAAEFNGAGPSQAQETAFFRVVVSTVPQPVTECGNAPLPIPNGAPGTTSGNMTPSIATVTDVGTIGAGYMISSVTMNIGHSWANDLDITLTSPNGIVLEISTDNGGSTGLDNPATLTFTDASGNAVTGWTGGAPLADYLPEGGLLNTVFAGEPMNGNWTLNIFDDTGGDFGSLNSYCINFEPVLGDPPIIVCPADITASNDPGACGAVVNFAPAVAIDPDGDLDEVVQTAGPPSGSEFPIGTTVVEFTAYDLAGNSASCSFNVTVTDDEAPEVTCGDITVELDQNGMATVVPGDVATATDNCPGVNLAFQSAGGPMGSITTNFASNNGGSPGWTVMYDVSVAAGDLMITAFDVNTSSTSAFTMDVYTKLGTYVGFQTNPGAWTLTATGSGTGAGTNNPSNVVLDVPFNLSANTDYAIAIVMTASPRYTNGNGANQSVSNADLSLSLGAAVSGLFSGSTFQPRVWNGTIYYGAAGPPVPSLDFTCAEKYINMYSCCNC